ncbi:hypothetical protein LTS15_010674 [Exophiala xenobiotica]|nr:hypothetical protein LTS15_010674 [Exophiala xenobiotica]
MSRREIYSQISRAYSSSPFYSDVDRRKDRFQLYMIFASGAVQLRDSGLRNAPIDYYTTAMEDASILADFPGQTQIQNTHLVMLFASHHDVGIGNHWDLARQAVRTCIQHGYHRAAVKPADPISEQMRRRLFWCSFISDLHQSHSIGRPTAISEQDITIELPLDANDEEVEAGLVSSPSGYSEVTILIRHCHLRKLAERARRELYGIGAADRSYEEKAALARHLNAELEKWRDSSILTPFPTNSFQSHEYFQINFHRERMRIFLGLVIPVGMETPNAAVNIHFLRYCLESASEVVTCYQQLIRRDVLVTHWTFVQDILRSGFIILYCGIQILRGLRRQSDEDIGPIDSEILPMVNAIDTTRDILVEISRRWKTVTTHRVAFEQLSEQVKAIIQKSTQSRQQALSEIMPHGDTALPDLGVDFQWDFDLFNTNLDLPQAEGFGLSDMELNTVFGIDVNGMNWQ